jgi:hypothetical protein
MPPYEFTADDADIILRASRCDMPRDFRVHRIILSIASPVFKDMFSVPQPVSLAPPEEATIPIIGVDDTPEDLEVFLRVIYPFGLPTMPTLDAISRALVILDKYQVQGGSLQLLRSLLVSPEFLKSDPIGVYSLACGWGFKEEADLAAPYTSSLDVLDRICGEHVQRMTGTEYHRILVLGRERRSRSVNYIRSLPTTCAGCFGYKKFYSAFREMLLVNFNGDCRVFYDYGRCVVRCFEIAVETTSTVPLGCGMQQDSHLGRFILALAEKLSSHS